MRSDPVIRKLGVFAQLSTAEASMVQGLCGEIRIVAKQRDLFSPGADGKSTYALLSGWAARYCTLPDGGRRILAFLLPGDFCDLNFADDAPMDHGIVAITECTAAWINKNSAEAIMLSTPALRQAWARSRHAQDACLRQWLVSAGRRSARSALAHLLCELYVRLYQTGLAAGGDLPLPASQIDLADAIGITAIHLNRTLRSLCDDGLIERSFGMHIADLGTLREIAAFDPRHLGLNDVRMFFAQHQARVVA